MFWLLFVSLYCCTRKHQRGNQTNANALYGRAGAGKIRSLPSLTAVTANGPAGTCVHVYHNIHPTFTTRFPVSRESRMFHLICYTTGIYAAHCGHMDSEYTCKYVCLMRHVSQADITHLFCIKGCRARSRWGHGLFHLFELKKNTSKMMNLMIMAYFQL